ncbi:MAG: nuclear transport factor 2 family protein [Bacteroidales bacterium]|nr:nuclear transport factor 2 family protein [Bacteroidales bacterium]
MKHVFIFLFVLAGFFFSCQKTEVLTEEQKTAIEQEIRAQADSIMMAINLMDASAISAHISQDGFISLISMVTVFSTREAWKDSVTNWFALRERQQVEQTDLQITVLSAELAQVTSTAVWDILWKNGEQVKSKDVITSIWKKEPAGWKQIHMHEAWEVVP